MCLVFLNLYQAMRILDSVSANEACTLIRHKALASLNLLCS